MPAQRSASQILDREFLEIRAKLLEVAASFDRLDRGTGTMSDDSRMKLIREGVELLRSPKTGRAEALQRLFSRTYDDAWKTKFGIERR